jgi:hypothetical protein
MATGAAVVGAGSLILGEKGRRDAKRQNNTQNQLLSAQTQLATDQWELYRDKILPLELEAQELGISARELAQKRGEADFKLFDDFYRPVQEQFATMAQEGVRDQTERATREAAETVKGQFENQKSIEQRNLERKGVRPDSGAYRSNERTYGLEEASATAGVVNLARENEADRVENENFNRLSIASGRAPGGYTPTQSPGSNKVNPNTAVAAYGNAANQYGRQANASAENAGGVVQGGLELAGQIYSSYQPDTYTTDYSQPISVDPQYQ